MEQFTIIGDKLLVRAPAKINLSLLIAGKRDDGFHEIESVMAKVDLYDELLLERSDAEGILLVCKGKYQVPATKDNLVYKAAELIRNLANIKFNIKITITKNIPVAAGLGGGSSDAASTLLGLNKFFNLGLTDQKLHELAAKLGSDINFFLGSPLAFCSGRGEKIKKIDKIFPFRAILLIPDITVYTKKVYENYKHNEELYRGFNRRIMQMINENNIDLLTRMCANMLAGSCYELHPELLGLKSRVEALGAGTISLSGSGSTLYCLLSDQDDVERYQAIVGNDIGCDSAIVNNNRW